jgi:hypothetical protein
MMPKNYGSEKCLTSVAPMAVTMAVAYYGNDSCSTSLNLHCCINRKPHRDDIVGGGSGGGHWHRRQRGVLPSTTNRGAGSAVVK